MICDTYKNVSNCCKCFDLLRHNGSGKSSLLSIEWIDRRYVLITVTFIIKVLVMKYELPM